MTGFFLSIEGIHGCGKSLLRSMLVSDLVKQGFQAIGFTDVGATQLGQGIRKLWLDDLDTPVDYLTEALLISASRRQNVVEIIKPNLIAGSIVITERFNDAMLAFQGYGRNVSLSFLNTLSQAIAEGIEPDYTVLLDLQPDVAMKRMESKVLHRIERLPMEFHEKLREGYLEIARQNPERIHIYDATQKPKKLLNEVLDDILPHIKMRVLSK
jgi:dTMP kinase